MAKCKSLGFIRIGLSPASHRTVRLAAAAKNTNMTAFVCEAALAAADEEVTKLKTGGQACRHQEATTQETRAPR